MSDRGAVIGLMPMKGHSERVPNKNLRSLGERPLFCHAMDALVQCPSISYVVVNTDSEAIADQVRSRYGDHVVIHRRPEAICGDFVSMNTIIGYDLQQVEGNLFLQTHSTNPFLKAQTVDAAIRRFVESGGHDSLYGVTAIRARCYSQDGMPINHDPTEMLRTQDLPPVLMENSNIYLFSRQSFLQTGRRIGDRPLLFEMDKIEALDIDDEEDFQLAEAVLDRQRRSR